jgi:hypothetical protein
MMVEGLCFSQTHFQSGEVLSHTKKTTLTYFRKQVKCSEEENSTIYLKDLVQTTVVRVSSLQGLHWVSGLGSCDPDLSSHPFVGIGTQIRL